MSKYLEVVFYNSTTQLVVFIVIVYILARRVLSQSEFPCYLGLGKIITFKVCYKSKIRNSCVKISMIKLRRKMSSTVCHDRHLRVSPVTLRIQFDVVPTIKNYRRHLYARNPTQDSELVPFATSLLPPLLPSYLVLFFFSVCVFNHILWMWTFLQFEELIWQLMWLQVWQTFWLDFSDPIKYGFRPDKTLRVV